jgi:hypothetical protein
VLPDRGLLVGPVEEHLTRLLPRSRREDRVFVYVNAETLVIDDPTEPGDETQKYLLPYDADLRDLEQLDPAKLKQQLDKTALSFAWIEGCFNKTGSADHVYLQSRHAVAILDCAFPGAITDVRFCPKRAGKVPRRGGTGSAAGVAALSTQAVTLVTTDFLERIVRDGSGRTIALTATPGEAPLDVSSAKLGGFAYYFTQFLDPSREVRFKSVRRADGGYGFHSLVEYAKDRIDAESRQVGRPQHLQVLGEREREYVVLSGAR